MVYVQNLDVTSFDFTALNKSKSEADAIKEQTEALAKDYDHLLQHQKKLQVISSKPFIKQLYYFNWYDERCCGKDESHDHTSVSFSLRFIKCFKPHQFFYLKPTHTFTEL